MRDRTRAPDEARSELTDAPFRLQAFVLRPAIRSPGRAHGGPAHRRWLSAGGWPPPTHQIGFQAYVRARQEPTERRPRLAPARPEHVHAWRLSPVVEALQAWRGVPCTVAVPLRAAMGDLPRCAPPRARMKCLGLPPSASSSGEPRRQGALTQAGNPQARRVRVAGAWASRAPAQGRRHWPLRLDPPPTRIQAIRWHAHVRLCHRYRRRVARGNHVTRVPGALARAWAGCRGAMAREGPSTPYVHEPGGRPARTQKVAQRAAAATQPRGGVILAGVQRRRQEARAETAAGTRRRPGRWAPPHGEPQEHPSPLAGSASADVPRTQT
jgi:transposase